MRRAGAEFFNFGSALVFVTNEADIVLRGFIRCRSGVIVIRISAIDQVTEIKQLRNIRNSGQPIVSVGRQWGIRRDVADVISMKVRENDVIQCAPRSGPKMMLNIPADPFAGPASGIRLGRRQGIRRAFYRAGIYQNGSSVGTDREHGISASG